jgi:hypothetical protein
MIKSGEGRPTGEKDAPSPSGEESPRPGRWAGVSHGKTQQDYVEQHFFFNFEKKRGSPHITQ